MSFLLLLWIEAAFYSVCFYYTAKHTKHQAARAVSLSGDPFLQTFVWKRDRRWFFWNPSCLHNDWQRYIFCRLWVPHGRLSFLFSNSSIAFLTPFKLLCREWKTQSCCRNKSAPVLIRFSFFVAVDCQILALQCLCEARVQQMYKRSLHGCFLLCG